jgi:hypothetical protein
MKRFKTCFAVDWAKTGGLVVFSPQCFFHLELKNFDTGNSGFMPVISAIVQSKVSTSGGGTNTQIERTDAKSVQFVVLQADAWLRWASNSRWTHGRMPLVAKGYARTLRTSNLMLNADYPVEFEFLLQPTVLEELEDARAGNEPVFGIQVSLGGIARYEFGRGDYPPGKLPYVVPFSTEDLEVVSHDERSHAQTIERSKWVEKLLPGLGFGNWMIYEVPVENFEGSAQVDVYLRNAVKQFLTGEYKLSITASRDVVETLERALGANSNLAFGNRFGSADEKARKVTGAYGDLVQAMLVYQGAVKSLLAAGAHPERPDELVERPDAEMALSVALALRRYVGMRLRAARPLTAEGGNPI